MGPKGLQLTGKVSIPALTDAISRFTDRPVLDMTELKGNFDIDLSWKPDGQPGGPVFLGQGKPLKLSGFNWPFPFRFNNIDSSSRSDTSGPPGGGGRPPEGATRA